MPDSTSLPAKPSARYNPNSEPAELDKFIASNWELMRRAPEFREIAEKWISSPEFRISHVRERKVYRENPHARCALDWMLTPKQRYDLATFQMQNKLFFWKPADNYGPIDVAVDLGRQRAGIEESIARLFDVTPAVNAGTPLRVDRPWPRAPKKFRSQFASIFGGQDLVEIDLNASGRALMNIGDGLLSDKPMTAEDKIAIGQYLSQLGGHYCRLSKDCKIPAIRRHHFFSEDSIDAILQRIKNSLPYQPKTGADFASKRSFLGTHDQWDKFLAWEAHGGNGYAAASEFLPAPIRLQAGSKPKPGTASRSEKQRDTSATIRRAVRAIQSWYPKIYPVRNLGLNSVPTPKSG